MAKRVSAAKAKAHLSDLIAEVAFGGEHYIIERRGRPLAALVSVSDLERLEAGRARPTRPAGALALVGAWRDVDDQEMDSLVNALYERRARDTGRSVSLET